MSASDTADLIWACDFVRRRLTVEFHVKIRDGRPEMNPRFFCRLGEVEVEAESIEELMFLGHELAERRLAKIRAAKLADSAS